MRESDLVEVEPSDTSHDLERYGISTESLRTSPDVVAFSLFLAEDGSDVAELSTQVPP
jgi:hypothetical protein